MKPLGFSLEETRTLLESVDRLNSATTSEDERAALSERLDAVETDLAERCSALRRQLEMAEEFAERLRRQRERQSPAD
jgi:DNA-binding transcriptional MerR regulator